MKRRAGSDAVRRRRLTAAAVAVVFVMASNSAAFAENEVCFAQSCSGKYAAVTTTGEAQSSQGVAVSGTGYSWGGIVGVTGVGDAGGGIASVDPSRSLGEAADAAYTVTSTGEFVYHTAVALTADPYQAWVEATSPPNPVEVANRLAAVADNAPGVAQNMAEGLLNPPPDPLAGSTSTTSSSTMTHTRPPAQMDLGTTSISQSTQYRCVPATAYSIFSGMPGQEQLAREMGTDKAKGTPFKTAAAVINRYYSGPGDVIYTRSRDAKDLMDIVTTGVFNFQDGAMLSLEASSSHWPAHRKAFHAVGAVGYDHNSGGYLTLIDPYWVSMSEYQWGTRNGQGSPWPTPAETRWQVSLGRVFSAQQVYKGENVVF
jgi:hypothetical protein